jgi:hypothetical protein
VVGAVILVTLVLSQYASLTYNSPAISGLSLIAEANAVPRGIASPPSGDDWMIPRIVDDIKHDAAKRQFSRPSLVVLVDYAYFEQTLFLYYAYQEGLNLVVKDNGYLSELNGINSVCSADYVITRALFNPGELKWKNEQNIAGVTEFVESNLQLFELIGMYRLPDGSMATLYHRALSCEI